MLLGKAHSNDFLILVAVLVGEMLCQQVFSTLLRGESRRNVFDVKQ